MKRFNKHLILILLSIVTVAFNVSADEFEVKGICYYTTSDTTVEVTSKYPKYTGSVVIPSTVTYDGASFSVTEIGKYAFYECTGLTSVTIPNSVTEIGESAFTWCRGLTSVTIPNSVTEIGKCAFYECTGLTSVTISNSITSIGESAFENCTNLSAIYCYAATPPEMYDISVFSDTTYTTATLYVPKLCIKSFKAAAVWSQFCNIVEGDYDGVVDDVIADDAAAPAGSCSAG